MRFVILRILTHSELGMFHEYRRQGKEGSRQRAINFDWDVVDRVFPAAKDTDRVNMTLKYQTDNGAATKRHWLTRQGKNWRLEGNCPTDKCYAFVDRGCLFVMEVDAGATPATGAWAVFKADDPVAKAVLADGESSGLAKSAMIALTDKEGVRVLDTIAISRPDVFSRRTAVRAATPDIPSGGIELRPNPARLVQILGSVGHTMPSAVADLVDNSLSADATKVAITFGRPDGGHGRWLSIADDGRGMDAAALAEAMRVGSASEYEDNALGKYGFGLKGASWSQTNTFTVVSKRSGKREHHLTWDAEDMKEWIAKSDALEAWEREATTLGDHGTAVLWKDMRPPQAVPAARGLDPYSTEIMLLERHLALVFHRFIEGTAVGRKRVVISINGNPVKPNNPVGHPCAVAYDLKTIRIPTGDTHGKVEARAYLLPSEEEIDSFHRSKGPEAVRLALDLIGLHGKRNDTQGLFIYRHERLIKWGGWHQMWETNDEKTKLARVVIDFDRVLDDALHINISKQLVQLPQQLQAEIKKIADPARKDSQKKFRRSMPPPPSGVSGTTARPAAPVTAVPATTGSPSAEPVPPPADAKPRLTLRVVTTRKFAWKVTTGLAGRELQVSDVIPALRDLAAAVGTDTAALAHLVAFLEGLDEVHAQSLLQVGQPS